MGLCFEDSVIIGQHDSLRETPDLSQNDVCFPFDWGSGEGKSTGLRRGVMGSVVPSLPPTSCVALRHELL